MRRRDHLLRRGLACASVFLALAGVFCPNLGNADATARTLSFYNIHTHEYLTVTYKVNDRYVPSAMAKIDYFMRDWRANKEIRMNPELIDLIWTIYTSLHAHGPIDLISGYRSPATNAALRRAGGGQARFSQHMLGKAADIHIRGVSLLTLRNSALITEWGGVGYYPRSGFPFVHVDVGRVRMWPRLPRLELAALFPSGHSGYLPIDGRPITKRDYRIAAASGRYQLASEVFPRGHAIAVAANEAAPQAGVPASNSAGPPLPTLSPRHQLQLADARMPALAAIPASYHPMTLGAPDAAAVEPASGQPVALPSPRPRGFIYASAGAPDLSAGAALTPAADPSAGSIAASERNAGQPAQQLSSPSYTVAALMHDTPVGDDRNIAPLVRPEQTNIAYLFEDLDIPEGLSLRNTTAVMSLATQESFTGPAVRSLYAGLREPAPTRLAAAR
jgi:uncharacterized protein YcbK (DUF882 family)